jgi:signal peptidase II|tara:strand:+ start:6567 stop:7055 length:489 start_codon:yes stop_codon:yes gene_type:complete
MRLNIISIKNIICLILIIISFFLDRISKLKVVNDQLNNDRGVFINEYLNIDLTWNTGIGFGLLNLQSGMVYNLISAVITLVILIIIFLLIKTNKKDSFFYAIIAGGALGNLYDRLFYFAVPDFIDIHIANYHWFTFNIADIFISIGIIGLILNEVSFKDEKK